MITLANYAIGNRNDYNVIVTTHTHTHTHAGQMPAE